MSSIDEITEQLKLATLQKQLAEARRDEAKAQKETTTYADATNDLITAYSKALKKVAITPPDGKITTTGESIEVRVLAQHTLAKALTAFLGDFATPALAASLAAAEEAAAKEATPETPTPETPTPETPTPETPTPNADAAGANSKSNIPTITLVLIQPADVAALELYGPTMRRLQLLQEKYSDAVQQARQVLNAEDGADTASIAMIGLGMALPSLGATTVVSSAAKLLALFRTTTAFTNTALTVDSMLLTSTLVQVARKPGQLVGWQVFVPSLFPIDALQEKTSPFLEAIAALEDSHSTGQQVIHALEARVQSLLMTPGAQQDAVDKINNHLNRLKAFDESYNQLQLGMAAAGSPIMSLAKSERLVHRLLQPNTYPVFLTATSKGSTQIKSGLFISDRLRFSAGTELSYLVFDKDGAILCAGSVCEYTPYIKAEEIREKIKA